MAEWEEEGVQPTKVIQLYLCIKIKQTTSPKYEHSITTLYKYDYVSNI